MSRIWMQGLNRTERNHLELKGIETMEEFHALVARHNAERETGHQPCYICHRIALRLHLAVIETKKPALDVVVGELPSRALHRGESKSINKTDVNCQISEEIHGSDHNRTEKAGL